MVGRVYLELTTPPDKVEKMILQAMRDELNVIFSKIIGNIKSDVRKLTAATIISTDTYRALSTNGELAAHFGFKSGTEKDKLDEIINAIINSIEVKNTRLSLRGKSISGGITISILRSNFEDILNLPSSTVATENNINLPWLDWLLTRGDDIIISQHDIAFIPGKGRSGNAIMINNAASVWRVPPQFSGTINNNWLTRAILDATSKFEFNLNKIVQNNIEGAF